jgi:FkbM family methyltransferase
LPIDGKPAWDVGAHIGFFTLQLARRCSQVVAVEASPTNVSRLRTNLELNDLDVAIEARAISDTWGEVPFAEHGAMSHLGGEVPVFVDAVTLDELLAIHGPPAFVKIDIEGAELRALTAARQLLATRPILLIEMHGRSRDGAVELLERSGYTLEWIYTTRAVARPPAKESTPAVSRT